MLELNKVQKYFNKGKKNQIHVINNTTISFEEKGLVALLGPSGCGKTTLLNVVGGLDKIKRGSIYVNGKRISKKTSYTVDKIRNLNIGYIFQDYKLIDNLTVFDNVAIVLKMQGIKDKEEIKLRVEYVLEKVGMLRYKKRLATMLSGGEKQRVGIARAIVKEPPIILADEPTGNLDSKNTLEIMNIIKAISKNRLVILVTHEQNLAKFYATRIIEIMDGTITKDYLNEHEEDLDYEVENRFYLKDFAYHTTFKTPDNNQQLEVYSKENGQIKLKIIIKNNNVYIKSLDDKQIEVIDDDAGIELIDDHYHGMSKQEMDKYLFNFPWHKEQKIKYSNITTPINNIKKGFLKVLAYPFLKKVLLIGFVLAGIFIMYAASSIAASLTLHEEDFVTVNKNYVTLKQKKFTVEEYNNYSSSSNVKYILPSDSQITIKFPLNDYYQTNNASASVKVSLTSLDTLSENDLIAGTMPSDATGVILDKTVLTKALNENSTYQMVGVTDVYDFLNRTINIGNTLTYTVTGIVEKHNPSIYIAEGELINVINSATKSSDNYYQESDISSSSNIIDYKLKEGEIELKKGKYPDNDYEVLVNISHQNEMPLGKQINISVNNTKLTTVGYYDCSEDIDYYLVNQNTVKYNLIANTNTITIYPLNKDTLKNEEVFQNKNLIDPYQDSKTSYLKETAENTKVSLIVSGIIIVISLIEIFLMIRSSFLSRVKEVGILRAIGIKKSDIYGMFIGEIFAITTISSVPGIIFMAYVLANLSSISYLSRYIAINNYLIFGTIVFIYLFNTLTGIIPIHNTIKKKPAEILARCDVD